MLTTKQQKYNSVLVQTDSVILLAKTFMRFQEHYESPEFRGKIFTIGQIKKWYSEKYGADTYSRDWVGFNFPSKVLTPFKNGLFDPLIPEEEALLELFRYRTDHFYIIGANDESTIRHELAHALFDYSIPYSTQINHLCKIYAKQLKPVKEYLLKKGYHPEVINDEIQAYVTDNNDDFIRSNLDTSIIDKINKTYGRYA